MRSERGAVTFGPVVGIIVIVLAIIGLFALCSDSDGEVDTLGRIQLVDHEWDYGWDDDGDGGDGGYSEGHQGYGGGGGRSGDMEQDGDHNCRNFCFYGVPAPGQGEENR